MKVEDALRLATAEAEVPSPHGMMVVAYVLAKEVERLRKQGATPVAVRLAASMADFAVAVNGLDNSATVCPDCGRVVDEPRSTLPVPVVEALLELEAAIQAAEAAGKEDQP